MEFLRITSAANPRIKEAVRLRQRKRAEGKTHFVIEGLRIIESALEAGATMHEAFFTDHFASKKEGRSILNTLRGNRVNLFETTDQLLVKITDTETPQGIAAVASYETSSLESIPVKENPLYAVCDGIQEPGNLGTVIRTADAAGVDAVILLEGTCDVFIPKAIRATAGSIFHLPIAHAKAEAFVKWLRDREIHLAVTSPDANYVVFEADLDGPMALVFGNEGRGISSTMRKAADLSLKIPIYGRAESVNVAISAAVCLYEAVRQRKTKQGYTHI